MKEELEKAIKKIFHAFGLEISRRWNTPVGEMHSFLDDLKKRGLSCRHILDAGAYRGWFCLQAVETFPDSVYYLFEPLVEMQEELGAFCKRYPKSKYFDFAVGSIDGSLSLRTFKHLAWSGFMEGDIPDERTPRIVEVKKIDTLIKENKIQIPDLVKIDVQGYELEVLRGAEMLFGKTEVFIIETSLCNKHKAFPLVADVIAFMNERGYVVYDFPGFLRRKQDGSLTECDIAFVKRDSFLRKNYA